MLIAMSRYALLLLNIFLIVRAHSRPLEAAATPSLEPDRRRDLADFFDDDLLYTYGYTHDSYETFSPPEHTTFPFGGLFPDETQTRTDGQTRMTTSSTTSMTASETHHATAAAKPTHTPSKATPTTSVLPSASPSPVTDAAEAMHASDAKQWKVIGLIIICITFVGAAILTTVFFDAWWGFLRALVCRRRRGGGKEDMVPDWGTQSWEYKLPAEDGNRYQSATSLENIKREIGEGNGTGVGMGGGMGRGPAMGVEKLVNPFDSHPRGLIVSPQPFYNPHPLEPLVRRPSLSQRSPHAFP